MNEQTRHASSAPAEEGGSPERVLAVLTQELGSNPLRWTEQLRAAAEAVGEKKLEIAKVKAECTVLDARYGTSVVNQNGTQWDHERKHLLAELAEEVRREFARRGEKLTDGRVGDLAHEHLRYKRFIEEAGKDRAEQARLRGRRIELEAELELLLGKQSYVQSRVRMLEAMVYFGGRLIGLGG